MIESHRRCSTLQISGLVAAPLARACIISLWLCSSTMASNESYQQVMQGFGQLQQGNDQAALALFQSATHTDPKDAQAWLFLGTAFNQLGNWADAYTALNTAAEVGCQDPELFFQKGRAQLGLGDNAEAIHTLLSFESARPGRGQTSEFLGRAYMATGDYSKAGASFKQALLRDSSLRSTVLPYQAMLARRDNDQQAEWQSLDDLRWFATDSQTASALREQLINQSFDELGNPRPLKLSASISGGFNSKVRGIDVVAVQGDTHDASSGFEELGLSGSYTWSHLLGSSADQLTVAGAVSVDNYPNETDGDFLSGLTSVEYHRSLVGPFSGSLKLSSEHDSLNWRGFRDNIAGRADLQYRANNRLYLDAGYTGAHDDFLYPAPQVQDPDSISNSFSLDGYLNLTPANTPADQTVTARIGGSFILNRADGADFDYNGGSVVAGMDLPVIEHIRVQLLYTWSEDRYLNLNSLTANSADFFLRPRYKRDDSSNSVSLHLSRQLRELDRHLSVFCGYEYTRVQSNIGAYQFSQSIVSVGLNWNL